MKQFLIGALITILVIAVAIVGFRGANSLVSRLMPTPTPSATPAPTFTPVPSATAKPSMTPTPSYVPTTKGGLPVKAGYVKGVTTIPKTVTKKITTTTTQHLNFTLISSSVCPISYMTEVRDIKGPLTLRYQLIDNTSFGITIWKADGNEILPNTIFGGRSGLITTVSGVDYMKVRVESKSCAGNNDNWIKITAER